MSTLFTTIQILARLGLLFCLKNKHSLLILTVHVAVLCSCGKISEARSRNADLLMLEYGCAQNSPSGSALFKEIKNFYFKSLESSPFSFMNIRPRLYDFEEPLVLSPAILKKKFDELRDSPLTEDNAREIFYLFAGGTRFENQKCSFKNLVQKKSFDIRPYMKLSHYCLKKYKNTTCDKSEFQNMDPVDAAFIKDQVIELCRSLNNDLHCEAEYKKRKDEGTIDEMVRYYSGRFQNERFGTLFTLRPRHLSFQCRKIDNSRTVMIIKIYVPGASDEWAQEMINKLEQAWSSRDLVLKLVRVNSATADTVMVLPTPQGNSYVPDNNNRLVYLSKSLDRAQALRVLSHEFGHVLGFPDCYIEFFDNMKKELVYYEISEKNNNIMCSLKDNVFVQPEYLQQLREKSCIFN